MAVLTHEEEMETNRMVMQWYGWGSPIGLGVFALCLGIAGSLLRFAAFGF